MQTNTTSNARFGKSTVRGNGNGIGIGMKRNSKLNLCVDEMGLEIRIT